jgi:DNA-binding HxlR family transcriptional regulator
MGKKEVNSPRPAGADRSGILSPGQIFDPVARALEVIGDRWTLVLVRQFLAGPRGFQELRTRTGIAPRVLSSRLRQLTADGFVEAVSAEGRSLYALAPRGRSLEPIISSIALWWVRHGFRDLDIDPSKFTETSGQSVIEALPFLLREERAAEAHVTFEIRLTGEGGGVWVVVIDAGHCEVRSGFAEHADVRYTAAADVWCGVALGLVDARDAVKRGLMHKDGSSLAMDHYFYQIARGGIDLEQDSEVSETGVGIKETIEGADDARPRSGGERK